MSSAGFNLHSEKKPTLNINLINILGDKLFSTINAIRHTFKRNQNFLRKKPPGLLPNKDIQWDVRPKKPGARHWNLLVLPPNWFISAKQFTQGS